MYGVWGWVLVWAWALDWYCNIHGSCIGFGIGIGIDNDQVPHVVPVLMSSVAQAPLNSGSQSLVQKEDDYSVSDAVIQTGQ